LRRYRCLNLRHAFFQFPQPRPELLLDRTEAPFGLVEPFLGSPGVCPRPNGTHNRPDDECAQGKEYCPDDLRVGSPLGGKDEKAQNEKCNYDEAGVAGFARLAHQRGLWR